MSNLKQAKILFNTLLQAKLDSSLDYEVYEKCFLKEILSLDGGINKILESFKLNFMQGNPDACYTLAKVYEIGFYDHPKDEYIANLFTFVGHKLKNRECTKIIQSNPNQYEVVEYAANNLINHYIGANLSISCDDVILLAHSP